MSDERFHIDFERSGGFTGVSVRTSLDSADLSPEEARRFADLLSGADLPGLPAGRRAEGGRPDRFQYDLTVTRGGRRHQVSVGETEVGPQLRPLVDALVERARRR